MTGLSICIVGGSGSFGSALVHRLLELGPNRVCVFSRGEHRQSVLRQSLGDDPRLRWFIGDVRDQDRLEQAFYGCEVVVNAAALKRVEVVAHDPEEALKTNVYGQVNVLRAATQCGVERVLFISSDKASEPSTPYGLMKAIGELMTTAWNVYGYPAGLRSSSVRWGNVLGSAGSVLHTFRRTARRGEPFPITDAMATRFWIAMPAAVEFCVRVLDEMRGGDTFIPKMRSTRVTGLAYAVADLAMVPRKLAPIPIRPGGEKTHESAIGQSESARALDIGWGYVLEPATWMMPLSRGPWVGKPVGPVSSDTAEAWKFEDLKAAVAAVPEEP